MKKEKDADIVWSRLFGDIWEGNLSELSDEAFLELEEFFSKGTLDGNLGGVTVELERKTKKIRLYGCSQHNMFEINSIKLLLAGILLKSRNKRK